MQAQVVLVEVSVASIYAISDVLCVCVLIFGALAERFWNADGHHPMFTSPEHAAKRISALLSGEPCVMIDGIFSPLLHITL